jgi:N-acetylmuramoyl-L-alanine amidase
MSAHLRSAIILGALALASAAAAPEVITVASARGVRRVPVVLDHGFPALAAEQMGLVLTLARQVSPPGTAALHISGRPFVFLLDGGYFRYGGNTYTLASVPYLAHDSLYLPLQFFAEHLPRLIARYRWDAALGRLEELPEPATTSPQASAPVVRRPRIIAIDPGHGGVDVGMVGPAGRTPFLQEKDITLGIARAVARELEGRGLRAILTRDRDTLIALGDRGHIAASASASIFVSIHVNAANASWRNARGARGFETYFLAEARTEDARRVAQMENNSVRFETTARAGRGDPMGFILRDLAQNEHLRESSRLAELVQESLGRVHPAESRGVKQAGFMVLATSYMPAILIEAGFGSNDAEARYLVSDAGQRRLARAIAEGIEHYITEFERRVAAGNQ